VCSGAFEKHVDTYEQREYTDKQLNELKQKLVDARTRVLEGIAFVKARGTEYMDLHGRRLVDSAIAVLVGHLFLGQAVASERKQLVARRFIEKHVPTIRRDIDVVCSGDQMAIEHYQTLAGPVPAAS